MNTESMKQSLYSGVWGTIGPKFSEASSLLSQTCAQNEFGILMHSKTAAYETTLRSLGIRYKDAVLCAAYSDKMDAEVAAAIGATPLFADVLKETLVLSPDHVREVLAASPNVKALTVDYSKDLDLAAFREICREHSCALIVNAGDAWNVTFDMEGIYAVIFDFGICGAAVAGTKEGYLSLFAWHHCGHAAGTTESFTFDKIVGGDMRVSEWQAIAVIELLKERKPAKPVFERGYILACSNPAFKTEYFRKMTGYEGEFSTDCFPNAKAAVNGR